MQRSCLQCSASFTITDADLAFYEKVSPVFKGKKELIPPPTLCPECRIQRHFTWRNERALTRRTCDFCGKSIVSIYHADAPFPVYCPSCWWSDAWEGTANGQDVDLSQSFLQQFAQLQKQVPRMSLIIKNAENSEYCNHSNGLKNSYLGVCVGGGSENVYYGNWILGSRDLTDCYQMMDSELCYEGLYSDHNYRCSHITLTNDSSDSAFLYDCTGCAHCFCCWNLRHKSYCIENEQLDKEQYERRLRSIDLGSNAQTIQWNRRFEDLIRAHAIRKHLRMEQSEQSQGDFLLKCKNVRHSFDVINAEDCNFCYGSEGLKDCYDVNETAFGCELQCDAQSCDSGTRVLYSHISFDVNDVIIADSCHNCKNLFGCIGLKHKQYCILNKQYTKEEYENLVPKIIEHMRNDGGVAMYRSGTSHVAEGSPATGSWGEFFSVTMSPFCYNETVAQEYFPLTKDEVEKRGWRWRDETDELPKVDRVIPAAQLPDSIDDVPDDILNWAIECEITKRPFKIIKQELAFYRTMRLPVPRLHPDERHRRRMALRNPRKLWDRECMKCGKPIATSYEPSRPEIVYCESCYLASVY